MAQALIIIDMLNDFTLPGAPLEVAENRDLLPALKTRLEKARAEGKPVVFVSDAHAQDDREFRRMGWPPHAIAGTPGARVVDQLQPRPGEHQVEKTTYSGFYQTELDILLKKLGVNELVLTGCVSNICVLYTAADAVMRGYTVKVPRDCVASLDPEAGRHAFAQMQEVLGVTVTGADA